MRLSDSAITRRAFCGTTLAAAGHLAFVKSALAESIGYSLVATKDRARVLLAAKRYLVVEPKTITSFPSAKSPGGPHDFFSEADYFWPNPANPNGPYINRDGQSNPNNFSDHRKAMIALSIQMPALTAAWMLTRDQRYADHASAHLRAWFVTPATRMNTNL
jgi:hypothetical protein